MAAPLERQAVQWFDESAEDYLGRTRKPTDSLDPLLEIMPPGSRVLDVGCGPGVDANHMAQQGHRVIGVDAARRMLHVGRREFGDVAFAAADLRALPFRRASFHAVTALYSLIFMPKAHVVGALRGLAELLAARGLLLVVVQGGKPAEMGDAFFSVMTPEEIAGYVRDAGFDILRAWERAPRASEMSFQKLHVLAWKA